MATGVGDGWELAAAGEESDWVKTLDKYTVLAKTAALKSTILTINKAKVSSSIVNDPHSGHQNYVAT